MEAPNLSKPKPRTAMSNPQFHGRNGWNPSLFAIFVQVMNRGLVISYWIVSILLVAIVLTSLGYRFWEATLIGTLFLPGALAAKYFFPKVSFKNRPKGIKESAFIVLGILVGEILLFLMAHYYISILRESHPVSVYALPDIPQILTNPVFIAIILSLLAAGSYFFETWLDRKRPSQPGTISFTSDRKPVTLSIDEILYVESNDDVTTVVATGDRRFRNYTPISKWEANLKPFFIRIHRSYLVHKAAITRIDVDLLSIGDIQLPVSRKYRESVSDCLQ